MRKIFVSMIIVITIVSSIVFSPSVKAQSNFSDVVPKDSFYKEVMFLKEKGIINVGNDGLFDPYRYITRLEAVRMLIKAKNITDLSNAKNPGFVDIKPGQDGSKEIFKAVELGIITGSTNAKNEKIFNPNGTLTRAQMAKILSLAFELTGTSEKVFSDVPNTHWAYPYIQGLTKNQITFGYANGRFGINDNISRVQFSIMLARTLNESFRIAPEIGKTLPDGWTAPVLKSKWKNSAFHVTSNIFRDELGFVPNENVYSMDRWEISGDPFAITILDYLQGNEEVRLRISWRDESNPNLYRTKIIGEQIFQYYFEEDANQVIEYLNADYPPEDFIANGRYVSLYWDSPYVSLNIGYKPVLTPTGKTYSDGWTAPVLKSKWTPDHEVNMGIFETELGLKNSGEIFGIKGSSRALLVQSGASFGKQFEASIWLKGWESAELKESYRIPVISYELFKFYFEKDADKVLNYFNKNSIPEKFTANGRNCEVFYDEVGGNLILKIGNK